MDDKAVISNKERRVNNVNRGVSCLDQPCSITYLGLVWEGIIKMYKKNNFRIFFSFFI